MTDQRVRVSATSLRPMCAALFRGLGVPPEDADLTTDVFMQSELRGEESHGIRLLLHVLGRIRAGGALAKACITVERDQKAMTVLDAHHSLGQVVGARAMRLAMAKAREYGIGIVGFRNSNSYTSAKYYPLMAAAEGMLGLTFTNSISMIPPEGGTTPIVGNNPWALAAPSAGEFPFVLDMACAVAKEKIYQAKERGELIPPTWALGPDGLPTTNPEAALASGVLLPFGGYKAFGLALAHEVLSGVLMGGQPFNGCSAGFLPYDAPMNVSACLQAINIDWFVPLEEFRWQMDAVIQQVKGSARQPGALEVYVPGEQGFREERRRLREGIPLSLRVFEELRRWAGDLNVRPAEGLH